MIAANQCCHSVVALLQVYAQTFPTAQTPATIASAATHMTRPLFAWFFCHEVISSITTDTT